ncbi:uncharacterized mitochondrial protein AtMg00810-like [Nicotiana tomentosiformis]|uniref:uncharacterized mitochondrial protein AtMg00810-like n=1 Tax=Nicotiana tomentosiformis TaxID=4098 RepID=UPI00388C41A6
MQEEMHQFERNKVCHLVPRPADLTIIGTRWVFRNKLDEFGYTTRNKARLVVQGYNQEEWIDYDEIFAPVARMEATIILIAFASHMEFTLFQMDVKSAFLVWAKAGSPSLVYVDDIIFGATTDSLCEEFAKLMGSEFEISMMGELTFFLGLQVKQSLKGTLIGQQKYIKELLKRFDMEASKVIDTPIATATRLDMDEPSSPVNQTMYRGIIGSLLYLTASRPDIIFSIGLCARFQSNPKESHLNAAKRILRHLKGTHDLVLYYPSGDNLDLIGYTDADYAGYLVDRKSTSGMAHFLGSCLISRGMRKQNSVALSTTEAEYVAAASCCAQLLWIKQLLEDFGVLSNCVPLLNDNTSALNMAKNPVQHKRTKHIDVDTHDDYRANRQLMQYALVKRAKLTDARLVREPGSLDNSGTDREPDSLYSLVDPYILSGYVYHCRPYVR